MTNMPKDMDSLVNLRKLSERQEGVVLILVVRRRDSSLSRDGKIIGEL